MDSREYRKAVDQFSDMVYRIALNQTRNVADADDITQSVFLKLYIRGPKHASYEYIKRWLIRVTVNECKSLWRAFWRKNVDLHGVNNEDILDSVSSNSSLDQINVSADYEDLYEALAKLTENCRIVVHLFYFEGYSTPEIAEILGIREPTVRTRLARARAQLKDMLKGAWIDEQ